MCGRGEVGRRRLGAMKYWMRSAMVVGGAAFRGEGGLTDESSCGSQRKVVEGKGVDE